MGYAILCAGGEFSDGILVLYGTVGICTLRNAVPRLNADVLRAVFMPDEQMVKSRELYPHPACAATVNQCARIGIVLQEHKRVLGKILVLKRKYR